MKTVAEVTKNPNESPSSLIRRFTRRVQGSRTLIRVRGKRFFTRDGSELTKKRRALKSIERRTEIERLKKLGKIVEQPRGRWRR